MEKETITWDTAFGKATMDKGQLLGIDISFGGSGYVSQTEKYKIRILNNPVLVNGKTITWGEVEKVTIENGALTEIRLINNEND